MQQEKTRRVTLRDIAAKTGFSVNTVSHALKDQPDISDKTKQLIRKTAQEMGYIRNSSAVFLRSGVSKSIAIVLGDLSNPLFAIMVKGLEVRLKEKGYVSFVINTEEDKATERMALEMALEKNVDGIILCPSPDGRENVAFLQQQGVPFVLHGRYFRDMDTSAVLYDDQRCGYLATRHLLQEGHRKILFINAPLSVSSAQERLNGYYEALSEFGAGQAQVATVTLSPGQRLEQIRHALFEEYDYTAVVAFSDMIALEVISLLQEQQISVPGDISVVGFDNLQSNYLLPTQLTTVSSSKSLMVRKSVELLIDQIQRHHKDSIRLVLPAEIKIRETTKTKA